MSAAIDDTPSSLATARALREGLRLVTHGYHLTPVTLRRSVKGEKIARFHAQWRRDPDGSSSDPDQIRDWSAQYACSFAIVCGPSGVEGVDLDVKPDRDVDAVAWWATQGLPLGLLVVDTPCSGLHTFWRRRRERMLPTSASEVAPGVDTRSVGGVFFAPGAFVLGVDGEPEAATYTVQGPLPKVIDLSPTPNVVLDMWAIRRPESSTSDGPKGVSELSRFTYDQAVEHVRRHVVEPLKTAVEGTRNNRLNKSAYLLGHFVPAFFTEDQAITRLTQLAEQVGLDPQEIGPTIHSGLRDGMAQPPYTRIEEDPFDAEEAAPDPYEIEKAAEKRRLRLRREAAAELDAENQPPLSKLSFSAFLNAPSPEYLVPKMFYKDGLAVVFGAPGAAKSFFVFDIALCLATAAPWRGRPLGRRKVHYIMAEGQATNTLRAKGWLRYHDVDPVLAEETFITYDQPILLTDAGIVDYLKDVVTDKPDLIVLDTKNLMFAGKESQGDDYGAMLRVLHRIRQAAGGAAVVLIDHSGLTDDTRTRGSNAQKGGVETEIRVVEENGIRRAEITRDKSGSVGTTWLFRLERVSDIRMASDVEAPAVCVPVDASEAAAMTPFDDQFGDWNDDSQVELPNDVVAKAVSMRGAKLGGALRTLARFMRHRATGVIGYSRYSARFAIQERCRDEKNKPLWSRETIERAWDALVELERLSPSGNGDLKSDSLWVIKPGDPS